MHLDLKIMYISNLTVALFPASPIFVLRFVFSIIHGDSSVCYTECKPCKEQKRGRPGNEADLTGPLQIQTP